MQNVEPDPREISLAFHMAGTEIGQKGAFCIGLIFIKLPEPVLTFQDIIISIIITTFSD